MNPGIKIFIVLLTLITAILLEEILGVLRTFWLPPPLFLAAALFWCWRTTLNTRLFIAALAGLYLDSVSLYPWGSHTALLIFLAVLTEFLQRNLNEIRSTRTQAIALLAELMLFYLVLPLTHAASYLAAAIYGFLWAIILSSAVWLVSRTVQKTILRLHS